MYPEGAQGVELGKAVAILVENGEDIAAFANYVEGEEDAVEEVAVAVAVEVTHAAPQTDAVIQRASGERIFVSPIAKKMAD